jgi:tetratricopeptide (TPR) repeat protein
MQKTADLWDVLCRDLSAERSQLPESEQHVAAKKFREKALGIFGPQSPRAGDASEIAGDICQAVGLFDEAAKSYDASVSGHLAAGRKSVAARVTAKLALLFDHLQKYEEAAGYYRKALQLFDEVFDHSQDCMLLSNLAGLEKRRGDLPAAIKLYQDALQRAMKVHGETHPQVAILCNNLGVAQADAGDLVSAENSHMRALGIREQAFGAMHPDVAQSMGNLAVVYHMQGNRAKAEAYYKGAIATYTAHHHPDDPELESVKRNYAALLKK